jgi:hypothetical protein
MGGSWSHLGDGRFAAPLRVLREVHTKLADLSFGFSLTAGLDMYICGGTVSIELIRFNRGG